MAFEGYLIKVGNYTIPMDKYIRFQSYKTSLNVQDLDSYRDANGELHRTALQHKVNKVEFETPAMLTNTELSEFFNNIRNNYTDPAERKFVGTVYVPELDTYMIQNMYMSNPEPSMYRVNGNVIEYQPVRIAFIAY